MINSAMLWYYVVFAVILQGSNSIKIHRGRDATAEEIKAIEEQLGTPSQSPFPTSTPKPAKLKILCPYTDAVLCKLGEDVFARYMEMNTANANQTFTMAITYETIQQGKKMTKKAREMNEVEWPSGKDWLNTYHENMLKEWQESRAGQQGWEDVVLSLLGAQ
eukprot:Phypoly_transcript_16687.p1 GENE.Phypoly_transcript_16687~~Phypoly_transcript_16687.p1  ORF type:complete len:162 (+),score=11.60 Phypoly_transcript_16687:165-650(+)